MPISCFTSFVNYIIDKQVTENIYTGVKIFPAEFKY